MDRNLKLTESVTIHAPVAEVWKAVTDARSVQKFMWGTHVRSDWKEGSSITFEGEYRGKAYKDKGTILDIEKEKRMKYSFLSGGNEDRPENYSLITYDFSEKDGLTTLTLTQEGAKDQKALEHSKQGWKSILGNLKKTVEKENPGVFR